MSSTVVWPTSRPVHQTVQNHKAYLDPKQNLLFSQNSYKEKTVRNPLTKKGRFFRAQVHPKSYTLTQVLLESHMVDAAAGLEDQLNLLVLGLLHLRRLGFSGLGLGSRV